MAVSKFRSSDHCKKEVYVETIPDFQKGKTPLNSDAELAAELERIRKLRVLDEDSMKSRITF